MDFIVEKPVFWLISKGISMVHGTMLPASGIRTTVAGPFRGFLLRPLSNQMGHT